MIKFNFLVFLFIAFVSRCTLYAQELASRVSQIESNVVWINGKESISGFGFIIGQKDSTFYIVTANHTIDEATPDGQKPNIKVSLKNRKELVARLIHQWKEQDDDLALLSIQTSPGYKWLKGCEASAEPSLQDVPTFIAWDGQWKNYNFDYVGGRIIRIDPPYIQFSNDDVKPGASGAPLVTAKGIMGMVLRQDVDITALSIKKVKELITAYDQSMYQLEPLNLRERMILIPESESFLIGSDNGKKDVQPQHPVRINSFYLDRYEVSVNEYRSYLEYGNKRNSFSQLGADQPIRNISWLDAIHFCNWLSVKEGYTKFYSIDEKNDVIYPNWESNGYRLPTEAEWEYAASGGKSNAVSTTTPGAKNFRSIQDGKANEFKLVNMVGNVAEWCWDYYRKDEYRKRTSGRDNPRGPETGKNRVVRGSSEANAKNIQIYTRQRRPANATYPNIGFRLARNAS